MSSRFGLVIFALGLALFGAGLVRAESPAPDPWLAWADAEPLELASLVDRWGDDAVLSRLSAAAPSHARLAAILASPFLRSPELALPSLAELAGSRDPELAPPAARCALTIAQALAREGLARRELLPAALAPARAAVARAASSPRIRADLRLQLQAAAQLLGSVGVP